MSLMMHDAFANASPNIPFTLEATTSESRDRYHRLGFEVLTNPPPSSNIFFLISLKQEVQTINMGKGKVNASGIPASGEDAVGVSCWSMINVSRELVWYTHPNRTKL
jgi:hypothetical protein